MTLLLILGLILGWGLGLLCVYGLIMAILHYIEGDTSKRIIIILCLILFGMLLIPWLFS